MLLWGVALAQQVPTESKAAASPHVPAPGGWDAFALFQVRAAANDLVTTNPLLDGQVVGRLGGTNGVEVDPTQVAAYTEQRVGAFATWTPPILDGRAALTGAFEIDFSFGDRAYGTGGNVGGGFGGDQVNLQTRRLHASFFPRRGGHHAHVVLGLQFVGDGVADPTTSTPDQLLRSGGRLGYFGSEAAGVSIYGRYGDASGDRVRYRAGAYTLLEQGLSLSDDVLLAVFDAEVRPTFGAHVGGHLWYVQDRSGGTGGALGIGPTSGLWALQGGPRLDPYDGLPPPPEAPVDADLLWMGVDVGINAPLDRGPLGIHGVVVANVGRIYAPIVHDDDILGVSVDVEARARVARGDGSVARIAAVFASGGGDDPDRFGGVVTGNAYGIVGAPMPTLGTRLLFPDAGAINRAVAVVPDRSGAGAGIVGASASMGYDLVPGRLTAQAGLAAAATVAGDPWGTEVHAGLSAEVLLFCTVGASGAYVRRGVASGLSADPWILLATVDWLVL